jgi:hypothetical protein
VQRTGAKELRFVEAYILLDFVNFPLFLGRGLGVDDDKLLEYVPSQLQPEPIPREMQSQPDPCALSHLPVHARECPHPTRMYDTKLLPKLNDSGARLVELENTWRGLIILL